MKPSEFLRRKMYEPDDNQGPDIYAQGNRKWDVHDGKRLQIHYAR